MEVGAHRERQRAGYRSTGTPAAPLRPDPGRPLRHGVRRPAQPSTARLDSAPLTSLTGGNFFRHSRLRPRRSPCMFSSSFFTASGLLVPAMAPPGRPRAGRCSERAGAAPVAPRPRPTRLRPTPEPSGPGRVPSPRRVPPAPTIPGAGSFRTHGRGRGERRPPPRREGREGRRWHPDPSCPARPGVARRVGLLARDPSPPCHWVGVKGHERCWHLGRGGAGPNCAVREGSLRLQQPPTPPDSYGGAGVGPLWPSPDLRSV